MDRKTKTREARFYNLDHRCGPPTSAFGPPVNWKSNEPRTLPWVMNASGRVGLLSASAPLKPLERR